MRKLSITVLVVFLAIGLFFSNNIYGYFRFQSYCSSEGGLHVYEPLERNAGWLAKDKYNAKIAAQLDGVGFVRYTDAKDGKSYDVRFIGKNPQRDSAFEIKPANDANSIKYFWKHVHENTPNELRLEKFGYQILNFYTNKILVQYFVFGYEKYNRSHTLFDAPSESFCFLNAARNIDQKDGFITAINTAFKN